MGIGKCWDMETNGCANLQYTAASKSSSLDPTAKALANLGAIVEKDTKLSQILAAPTLTPEDKSAIVAELNKHAGGSSATVKNFLDTLAENNRLGLLQGVCSKFGQIMAAARGEVEMTVTSAQVRTREPAAVFLFRAVTHHGRGT